MPCYTVGIMRLLPGFLAVVLSLPVQVQADDVTVLVVRHRWHTGIAFPADQLRTTSRATADSVLTICTPGPATCAMRSAR